MLLVWLGISFLLALCASAMAPIQIGAPDGATDGQIIQRGGLAAAGGASKMFHAAAETMASAPHADMAMPMPEAMGMPMPEARGSIGAGFGANVVNEMRGVPLPPPPPGALSGAVVLKSGSFEATLMPGSLPAATAALEALVASHKGFVEASNLYTDAWLMTRWREAAASGAAMPAAVAAALAAGGSPQTHASLTLRVPVGAFERLRSDARTALTALGPSASAEVVSESTNAQDVTEAYADTVARLGTDAAALARMDVLLGAAATVHEVLSVKREMDQIEARLAGLEASRKATEGQARMASLHVSLRVAEPPSPAPPTPTPRPGWSPGATLGAAVAALGRVGAGAVDVTIFAAVFSVPVGAALCAGMLLWRRARAGGRADETSAE